MAENFRGPGDRTNIAAAKITAPAVSGTLHRVGTTHMVVLRDGNANDPNVGARTGVWELRKDTSAGSAGVQGGKAYADGSNFVTGDATGNVEIGTFEADVADGAALAPVRLNGFSV